MENNQIQCPSCGCNYYVKNGHKNGKQQYVCKKCGRTFTAKQKTEQGENNMEQKQDVFAEEFDVVNNPPHYKQGKIECWDATPSAVANLKGDHAASVTKIIEYVWRHAHKGEPIKDLNKAKVYIDRVIAMYKSGEIK